MRLKAHVRNCAHYDRRLLPPIVPAPPCTSLRTKHHNIGNRSLYNTFQVRQLDAQGNLLKPFGQSSRQRSDGARTTISRYEDGGSYVLATGQYLEDMYYSAVTSLSRQIVCLRPSQFIVYDRSGVSDKSFDQYEAFHFPKRIRWKSLLQLRELIVSM